MKPKIFKNNDEAYLNWIANNPNGYVINSYNKPIRNYIILHSSKCKKITTYNKMSQPGGFTERQFIKVCSNSIDELLSWVKEQGFVDFSRYCGLCKPL